jgi:hypothetical protein
LRAELIRERKTDHPEQVLILVNRAKRLISKLEKSDVQVDRTTLGSHRRWAKERIKLKKED